MRLFKKRCFSIIRNQSGQTLPIVLALLVLGGLTIVPSLSFASTNLSAGKMAETKAKAIYTAEAGIADAIWRLRYNMPASLPYSYQVSNLNGVSANVTISDITMIAGQSIGPTGVHGGWLRIQKDITYSAGVYTYTLSLTNNGEGNMRVEEVLIDLPTVVDYVDNSTDGDITLNDPVIVGTPEVGIALYWDLEPSYYIISKGDTASHSFQLSGPAGVAGIEGHSVVKATREDVGTVWDSDSRPYSITSQAVGAGGAVLTTLKVGVWKGPVMEISCWQINP